MPLCLMLVANSAKSWVFNNPYPKSDAWKSIFYASFNEPPKTLDPARSYSSNEYQFIVQIYEPPLQYDYFARPYQLVPLRSNGMPEIRYLDKQQQEIPLGPNTAYSVYRIHIQQGILYQPHLAFAKN